MNLSELKRPFRADEIEWRISRSGITGGKIWARVLAYVTNRAIMDRLDEVCGPENWSNEYLKGPEGGILCGISIRVRSFESGADISDDIVDWVTKWDGAENTDFDPVKGGLSGAMKRAATQWGIGRYLYRLEEDFATISQERTKHRDKIKGEQGQKATYFYWLPPKLPSWALPSKVGKVADRDESGVDDDGIDWHRAKENVRLMPESPERPQTEPQSDFLPKNEPDVEGVFVKPKSTKKKLSEMTDEELRNKVDDGIVALFEKNLKDPEVDEKAEKKAQVEYSRQIKDNPEKLIELIKSMGRKINPPVQGELV